MTRPCCRRWSQKSSKAFVQARAGARTHALLWFQPAPGAAGGTDVSICPPPGLAGRAFRCTGCRSIGGSLVLKHLERGSAQTELIENLRNIFQSAHERGFVQHLGHHNTVTRHESLALQAVEQESRKHAGLPRTDGESFCELSSSRNWSYTQYWTRLIVKEPALTRLAGQKAPLFLYPENSFQIQPETVLFLGN